ncbi:unnamed protein product, partial [Caretta caretta]
MGRALLPQQDAGEWELPAQGPPWREGGPAPPAATLRVLILALLWRGSLSLESGYSLGLPQSVSVQMGLCVLVPCTFAYPASYDTDNPRARLYGHWYKEPATAGQDPPVASSDPSESGLTEEPEIQISPARGLPGTLLAGEPVTVTCTAPGRCSGPPPRVTWTGPFSNTARDDSALLANGTWARSSTLRFTPGLGGPRQRARLQNYLPPTTGTFHPQNRPATRRPDLPGPPNITGTLTRNGRSVPDAWGAEGDVVSLETQEGDSLSLGCEAGSRPEATLSWAKGNESLSPGQGGAGRLELPNLSRGDAGEYRCWAKNPFGSASRALCVHVQLGGAGQRSRGSQLTAREGDSLRFLCSVASNPPAVLGWVRGGRAVEGARPTGENQLQLELPNVTAEDGGLYGCWARNKESSAQGTFQLLVE